MKNATANSTESEIETMSDLQTPLHETREALDYMIYKTGQLHENILHSTWENDQLTSSEKLVLMGARKDTLKAKQKLESVLTSINARFVT